MRDFGARISGVFDRLPIRTRLAGVSALLTFVILCAFALIVGSLTVHRIRADFNREVAADAADFAGVLRVNVTGGVVEGFRLHVISPPSLDQFAAADHAVIRILTPSETLLESTAHAPNLGMASEVDVDGYRVNARVEALPPPIGGAIVVQYARPLSDVQDTIARVELLLVLGTLAGSGLALLAGATIARRAMAPIATLTTTAAEIARTRDPSATVPRSDAEDEVAELARTLQGMLDALDDAHAETEAMLARQRRFVADASHELRTPLTSVLANLELLAESLQGDQGEAARSALRSSRRMRRLVADLLLLARSDVKRERPHEPVDLARLALDAAAELGPLSGEHDLSIDAHPAVVEGDHDELFRLTLNLIENALRHTPPGTAIRVSTGIAAGARERGEAVLAVEDSGPGVAPTIVPTLFERFVRGSGGAPRRDGAVGGSFGLGLAIVRAVAHSHGGSVALHDAVPHGARFVVRLPLASDLDDHGEDHRPPLQAVVDQLR